MNDKKNLDEMVSGESLRILKATLPYLPPNGQRMLSILVKTMELNNTISIFRSSSSADMHICASSDDISPLEMLKDIQEQCSERTKDKIEQLINLYVMLQVMELSNEISI